MATDGPAGANTPSVEAILDALRQHPNATAAELAEAASIGRSTAGKALATLEAQGRATRQRGTPGGGRATPDRWALATDSRAEPQTTSKPRVAEVANAATATGRGARRRSGAPGHRHVQDRRGRGDGEGIVPGRAG
jgi:predicted ArsR family transcriptional regulator